MARILFILLISTIVMGLLPMPHPMLSMQTMRMEATTASYSDRIQEKAGDHPANSCCDAMGPLSPTCDLLVSQPACYTLYGDNERVVNSDPVVQTIYIEAVSPPPKA